VEFCVQAHAWGKLVFSKEVNSLRKNKLRKDERKSKLLGFKKDFGKGDLHIRMENMIPAVLKWERQGEG